MYDNLFLLILCILTAILCYFRYKIKVSNRHPISVAAIVPIAAVILFIGRSIEVNNIVKAFLATITIVVLLTIFNKMEDKIHATKHD